MTGSVYTVSDKRLRHGGSGYETTCRSVYTVSDKRLRHGGSGYETTCRSVYTVSDKRLRHGGSGYETRAAKSGQLQTAITLEKSSIHRWSSCDLFSN